MDLTGEPSAPDPWEPCAWDHTGVPWAMGSTERPCTMEPRVGRRVKDPSGEPCALDHTTVKSATGPMEKPSATDPTSEPSATDPTEAPCASAHARGPCAMEPTARPWMLGPWQDVPGLALAGAQAA